MSEDRAFPAQEQEPPGSTASMRPQPRDTMEHYRGRGLLQEKKALITGGDSGIGRAVAIAFASSYYTGEVLSALGGEIAAG